MELKTRASMKRKRAAKTRKETIKTKRVLTGYLAKPRKASVDKARTMDYPQGMIGIKGRRPGPLDILILLGAFVNLVVITAILAYCLFGG